MDFEEGPKRNNRVRNANTRERTDQTAAKAMQRP